MHTGVTGREISFIHFMVGTERVSKREERKVTTDVAATTTMDLISLESWEDCSKICLVCLEAGGLSPLKLRHHCIANSVHSLNVILAGGRIRAVS